MRIKPADEVDNGTKLISCLIAELERGMDHGQKDDRQCLDQEVVVANLLRPIQVRHEVNRRNRRDCVLCYVDSILGKFFVFLDTRG